MRLDKRQWWQWHRGDWLHNCPITKLSTSVYYNSGLVNIIVLTRFWNFACAACVCVKIWINTLILTGLIITQCIYQAYGPNSQNTFPRKWMTDIQKGSLSAPVTAVCGLRGKFSLNKLLLLNWWILESPLTGKDRPYTDTNGIWAMKSPFKILSWQMVTAKVQSWWPFIGVSVLTVFFTVSSQGW